MPLRGDHHRGLGEDWSPTLLWMGTLALLQVFPFAYTDGTECRAGRSKKVMRLNRPPKRKGEASKARSALSAGSHNMKDDKPFMRRRAILAASPMPILRGDGDRIATAQATTGYEGGEGS